tara:strand:+ start:513 stop:812 length:300 start_codon:yes stop_codon:yes gene_type:complete
MPTKREREYYRAGFMDGLRTGERPYGNGTPLGDVSGLTTADILDRGLERRGYQSPNRKVKRKLSAWQKYIKNKRNHITYRDGKLNLKAMGVQYRKKKRR